MPSTRRIVIVDDDTDLSETVADFFAAKGIAACTVSGGAELRRMTLDAAADVVLLDLGLPGEDGLDLLHWLLARDPGLPVMVVSGRQGTLSRVQALEAGAVDYVIKPFDLRELSLRLQRFSPFTPTDSEPAPEGARRLAHWSIFPVRRLATDPSGREVELTHGELRLLMTLLRAGGRTLDRRRLAELTADGNDGGSPDAIAVLIHRLRQKLEANPSKPALILNVPGRGYRLG